MQKYDMTQAMKLRKYKERRLNGYHGGPKMGENLADVLNSIEVEDESAEDDDYTDPEQTVVTKVKRWDDCSWSTWSNGVIGVILNFCCADPSSSIPILSFDLSSAISVKEAIFALDYIDHDFYVFRDEETNAISVVYKRNAGGVGLIQPEQ